MEPAMEATPEAQEEDRGLEVTNILVSKSAASDDLTSSGSRRLTYSEIMSEKKASLVAEADALLDVGKAELAVRRLSKAIILNPEDPELFRRRAEASFMQQDYHGAIINFKKAVALNEELKDSLSKRLCTVHYHYGMMLFDQDMHKEAADMFEQSAEYDSSNKDAIAKRMECLIAMQKYSECMGVIQQEVAEDDSNPDLFIVRAQMHLLFGKTSCGYHDVCKALDLNAEHPEAIEMKEDLEKKAKECKNQAIYWSLMGGLTEALRKMNMAIEIDSRKAEYYNLRGSVYRKLGDFNAAVDDFLLAMNICGHKEDSEVYKDASKQLLLTYNDFAMECFRQRQFDSAITLLNRAIKQEKREKGLYLNRGDCFYRMGNLQFALSDYQQALELEPSNWEVYCRLGVVCCEIGVELFARGNYVDADHMFSAAIQYNPKVSWFYTCRAWAKYELKDLSGSKEDVVFAVVLDPKSDESLSLIARVFLGKTKEDLLCSYEAIRAQVKLRAVFKHTAVQYMRASQRRPATCPELVAKSPKKLQSHLDGINLKVAEDELQEKAGEKGMWLPPVTPTRFTRKEEGPKGEGKRKSVEERLSPLFPNKDGQSQEGTEWPIEEEETETIEEEKKLKPREWPVLSCSLPKLSNERRIMASLKKSVKEERFHKSIYYTKKECDLEMEAMLASPPEKRPPLPRLQDIHDVVIGGRSIVSGNTLIKSLKR